MAREEKDRYLPDTPPPFRKEWFFVRLDTNWAENTMTSEGCQEKKHKHQASPGIVDG
jgi:hypothetical protein